MGWEPGAFYGAGLLAVRCRFAHFKPSRLYMHAQKEGHSAKGQDYFLMEPFRVCMEMRLGLIAQSSELGAGFGRQAATERELDIDLLLAGALEVTVDLVDLLHQHA